MDTGKIIMFGIYALVLCYIFYRMLRKNPMEKEYERLYSDILTSKKYKVKGQFEKDD